MTCGCTQPFQIYNFAENTFICILVYEFYVDISYNLVVIDTFVCTFSRKVLFQFFVIFFNICIFEIAQTYSLGVTVMCCIILHIVC